MRFAQDLMDPDIRAAMFDPSYEAEELEDDFVLQASQAPQGTEEDGGFDYDAHIARLIAASERRVFVGHEEADDDDDEDSCGQTARTAGKGGDGDVEAQFLEVHWSSSWRERAGGTGAGTGGGRGRGCNLVRGGRGRHGRELDKRADSTQRLVR